jgi:hypothetical protein
MQNADMSRYPTLPAAGLAILLRPLFKGAGAACHDVPPQAISAHFKAPIALGSRVELRVLEPAGSYQVWAAGKLAVAGRFG